MQRVTGKYRSTTSVDEEVRAFIPFPLPPSDPPLILDEALTLIQSRAAAALQRLSTASIMVPSADWFLYGFVRKEAVITSQIEGTQATMRDVLEFEATRSAARPDDVQEVCNYVSALTYARQEIARPQGLPLSSRLLCETHRRLMAGARGVDKLPGEIRRSQNWVGGSRPGNASFVPPPPDVVPEAMSDVDRWIHADDPLPPLVRAGLAHVQFETIHPFLDGNGRIGRLLVALLVEHWGLLSMPLLYVSLAFKRRRDEYYRRLASVRTAGDWEGWTAFFLECVCEAAEDGVETAQRLSALLNRDRHNLLRQSRVTVPAIRLLDHLPNQPIITLSHIISHLETTKPTAAKAIDALQRAGVLEEITGKKRDRVYAYRGYLQVLTKDT